MHINQTRLASIMPKYCIIILFQNSSMLLLLFQCKSYFCYNMLISWLRKHLKLKRDKHPSSISPALHPRCCHQWSECHYADSGRHFSEFSQLTPSNFFFLQPHDDLHIQWRGSSVVNANYLRHPYLCSCWFPSTC